MGKMDSIKATEDALRKAEQILNAFAEDIQAITARCNRAIEGSKGTMETSFRQEVERLSQGIKQYDATAQAVIKHLISGLEERAVKVGEYNKTAFSPMNINHGD